MRRFYGSALIGVFMLGAFFTLAHADEEVLVPSDENSSGTAPDVALTPESQPPSHKPAEQAPEARPLEEAPAASSTTLSTTPPAGMQSESTTSSPVERTQVMKIPYPDPKDLPQQVTLPSMMPDGTPNILAGLGATANSLGIDVSDKITWGPNDLAAIHHTLGLSGDDVSQNCHLSLTGIFQSDSGMMPFDMGPSAHHTNVGFNGSLTSISLTPEALCDSSTPLPKDAGFVVQLGDKYMVLLKAASCPTPPQGTNGLVVQYNGDGKVDCSYQ